MTQVRNIHGEMFDLDNQHEPVIRALEEDGVLVISQCSKIAVPMNSLNIVQAREVWGTLGFTTFEFLEKEIFMSAAVGKVLFLLHTRYSIGTSKLLIPVPQFKDPILRPYNAYVAALFGGPNDARVAFDLSVNTARGERKALTVFGGDILVCTDKIERTIPQTHSGTAFISETFYYPHMTPPGKLAPPVEGKLANDYMLHGGAELERGQDGSVVWSRDRFMMSCRV